MIQNIAPSRLDNRYIARTPETGARILLFDMSGRMHAKVQNGQLCFPSEAEVPSAGVVYLFSVDETRYFLAAEDKNEPLEGFGLYAIRELRDRTEGRELFAAFTAWHLWKWYRDNRFCGRCGSPNGYHDTERALQCTKCGQLVYPRINPAVIVGVINGDPSGMPEYVRWLTIGVFLLAGFIQAYVWLTFIGPTYMLRGSIAQREIERKEFNTKKHINNEEKAIVYRP